MVWHFLVALSHRLGLVIALVALLLITIESASWAIRYKRRSK